MRSSPSVRAAVHKSALADVFPGPTVMTGPERRNPLDIAARPRFAPALKGQSTQIAATA
jgi:hypothetical protein